jgi:serine O-acetyltransferase
MKEKSFREPIGLIYLLTFSSQYRNVFYYRIKKGVRLLNLLLPKLSSLKIQTEHIGEGFVVLHGIASLIGAGSIGKNCKIYQQVTIGAYDRVNYPTILDNVTINAGAVIIGNVTIGNNVVIGANATVTRNIPDNCTVLPGSCRVIKWSGKSDIHKSQHWD